MGNGVLSRSTAGSVRVDNRTGGFYWIAELPVGDGQTLCMSGVESYWAHAHASACEALDRLRTLVGK